MRIYGHTALIVLSVMSLFWEAPSAGTAALKLDGRSYKVSIYSGELAVGSINRNIGAPATLVSQFNTPPQYISPFIVTDNRTRAGLPDGQVRLTFTVTNVNSYSYNGGVQATANNNLTEFAISDFLLPDYDVVPNSGSIFMGYFDGTSQTLAGPGVAQKFGTGLRFRTTAVAPLNPASGDLANVQTVTYEVIIAAVPEPGTVLSVTCLMGSLLLRKRPTLSTN